MSIHSHRRIPWVRPRCMWCLRSLVPNHEWLIWETLEESCRRDEQTLQWLRSLRSQP